MSEEVIIYRAAWVVPVTGEPIENGELVTQGDRIVAVRPAEGAIDSNGIDFGDAILIPGLVNVHTHLDYTFLRGCLEDVDFFPWIRELTARAFTIAPEDWAASATWGAAEAVSSGVTTIGDCSFSGAALHGAKTVGLGGIIYQEVFGIDEHRSVPEILIDLQEKVAVLREQCSGSLLEVGISPHAPYTVRAALMRALGEYAEAEKLPVCIHAAESQAESSLLQNGSGPFAEMFARRGIAWEAPGTSTVAYLGELGVLGSRTLLVHGVQISASDRTILERHDVAWAHCPKSNAKLGAGIAPLGLLSQRSLEEESEERDPGASNDAEVRSYGRYPRVGLGSDSVASNNTVDLFEEMRFAVLMQRAAHRKIEVMSARAALELATIQGAHALRMESEIGSLEPCKRADFCVVALDQLHNSPVYDPYNALVYAARGSDVLYTVVGGKCRYDSRGVPAYVDRFPGLDLVPVREQLYVTQKKMRDWRPSA